MSDQDTRSIETVVIGAGQAGLMMSWHLQRAGREHVVLERRDTLGGGWQDRWDAFRLVSPDWLSSFPGFAYDDGTPDDFMPRDAIAARVARYATVIGAPVERSTAVERLAMPDGGSVGRRFKIDTSRGSLAADHVIVATGAFQVPRIPAVGAGISARVAQVHAHDYRAADRLPEGGVLIVGSGQTGVQLAEELQAAGRDVVLATGRCGRQARRYRGHDIFWWVRQVVERGDRYGTALPGVDALPDPRLRFVCNPHLSGHGGGHDTNLRQMARDGIRLTGRLAAADGERLTFAPDLRDNLAFADRWFDTQLRPLLDAFAAADGVTIGPDDRTWPTFDPPEVQTIDLAREGIGTVLWTTGYARDDSWLGLPVFDAFGTPRHVRGVSEVPGLTFIGLLFQLDNASANLLGMDRDAAYLAGRW
jgi:putative flavoprotein involved in K+ transport